MELAGLEPRPPAIEGHGVVGGRRWSGRHRKFILLVEEGTTLPSNLQGLYEVRYSGDELDYPATIHLPAMPLERKPLVDRVTEAIRRATHFPLQFSPQLS